MSDRNSLETRSRETPLQKTGLWILALTGSLLGGLATIGFSSFNSPLTMVVLIIIFLGTIFLSTGLDLINDRFDAFEIKNVFLLFYGLNSLSVPIRCLFDQTGPEEFRVVLKGFALCLAGLLSFIVGYSFRSAAPASRSIPLIPSQWSPQKTKWIARVYIVGGFAVFLAVLAFTSGIRQYFTAGYGGRALLKSKLGPLELGLYISLIGILLYYSYFLIARRRPSLLFWGSVSGFILLMSLIGIRRPTFWILLGAMAIYHYLGRRISFMKAVLAVLVLGGGLIVFAFTRHIVSEGDFFGGLNYARDNFSWSWFDISRTELGAPFNSLTQILKKVPESTPYFYGSSYLETPLILLPRVLYPNRPDSISGWYERTFFSEDFVAEGGSMGVFIVAEAYVNFGDVGVIVIMFLWGFFFKKLYEVFKRHKSFPPYVFLYAISLAWIIFLMRLDFAGALKGYLVTALLPAIPAIYLAKGKAERG